MRLEETSQRVNSRLLAYLETHFSPVSLPFREDVLYATSIAATLRERTYITRLAAELCHIDWEIAEPVGLAAELFIISALTADDVLDGSLLRSGRPTLMARTNSAQAFLVAEYLHSIGHEVLRHRPPSVAEETWCESTNQLRLAFNDLLLHQYLVSSLEGDTTVTITTVDELAYGRTGRLLEACFTAPAILSGSSELRQILGECGRWCGIAFQHRDDILDFIGTPEVLGKPILLDLLNGQPNLVLSHALTIAANQAARNTILKYFGSHRAADSGRESAQQELLAALVATGSLAFAAGVVVDYCNRALNSLSVLPPSEAKEELIDLIRAIADIELPWKDER